MTADQQAATVERLCSRISRASGEDPVGSAPSWERCLFIEVDKPWLPDLASSRFFPGDVSRALANAGKDGADVRLQGIEPDDDHSVDDHHRVMLFTRPGERFATFEKDEYVVPPAQLGPLAEALVGRPEELSKFPQFRQDTGQVRDIFVCTHGTHDTCCGTFGYPVFEDLRDRYAAESGGSLRIWRTSHTGGHRLAPNIIDMPEGRYWCRLENDELSGLVRRDRPASDLRSSYRGWVGLESPYERVAEREILMQEGWDWTGLPKSGRVLSESEDKSRAEVRIDFVGPGDEPAAYEATVELQGTVVKANCMAPDGPDTIPQYGVTRLAKVS